MKFFFLVFSEFNFRVLLIRHESPNLHIHTALFDICLENVGVIAFDILTTPIYVNLIFGHLWSI